MNAIETVKKEVKEYNIVPFSAREISCDVNQNNPFVVIRSQYSALNRGMNKVMDAVGIRKNLTKDIFNAPRTNWAAIQNALNNIDKDKQFTCIVDKNNEVVDVIASDVKEVTQLNYDRRIDQLIDSIESSENYDFQGIVFNPSTSTVEARATNRSHIDCGVGDDWKFGSSVMLSHNANTFQQYYLRLICSNGMTTRENIAYRQVSATKDVGRQFTRFTHNLDLGGAIRPKVERLRKSRASLYELMSVADCLSTDDRDLFFPEYKQTEEEFTSRGFSIDGYDRKRQKFIYTNHNLYDIFNCATNIATHRRDIIGDSVSMGLNKAASDIFSRGPQLDFNVLDIYKQ